MKMRKGLPFTKTGKKSHWHCAEWGQCGRVLASICKTLHLISSMVLKNVGWKPDTKVCVCVIIPARTRLRLNKINYSIKSHGQWTGVHWDSLRRASQVLRFSFFIWAVIVWMCSLCENYWNCIVIICALFLARPPHIAYMRYGIT